jgi:hypothetical protein
MVANDNHVPVFFVYFANYTDVMVGEVMLSYANTKDIGLCLQIAKV